MPKVSVILTSYNHEKYLQESIDSVLGQTFTDFELIVVDDCSIDNSWNIIESYKDERLVTIRNPENKLFYVNSIIKKVTQGKYIALQHSDDVWEPNKLAEQVAFLDMHPECGAAFSWTRIIDEDGNSFDDESNLYCKVFEQPNRTRHEWLNYVFYKANALCHPSVLIRKQCYDDCGLYRYGFLQLADYDMWIRLCLKYEIHVFPQKLIHYRVRHKEANASALRQDTRIRITTECYQLWGYNFAIESFAVLALVFTFTGKYFRPAGCVIKFVFGNKLIKEA